MRNEYGMKKKLLLLSGLLIAALVVSGLWSTKAINLLVPEETVEPTGTTLAAGLSTLPQADKQTRARISEAFGKLPLYFRRESRAARQARRLLCAGQRQDDLLLRPGADLRPHRKAGCGIPAGRIFQSAIPNPQPAIRSLGAQTRFRRRQSWRARRRAGTDRGHLQLLQRPARSGRRG